LIGVLHTINGYFTSRVVHVMYFFFSKLTENTDVRGKVKILDSLKIDCNFFEIWGTLQIE
jgi:hypothetical protein